MLVAALQMQPVPSDAGANLAAIETAARSAAGLGATLLVAPEMGVTGYAIWDDIERLAEPRDGTIVTRLSSLARNTGLTIAAGFPERDGAVVYNSMALITSDGTAFFYRKCHLYGPQDKAAFVAGTAVSPIIPIGGFKAGLLICYDAEFPEMARSLAMAGADLLLVPTALPKSGPNDRISRVMIPTRALENHMFVVYAGLCGQENGQAYQGGSVIVGQDGEDLARAGTEPAFLLTQLKRNAHANGAPDPYLTDRRPDIY